MIGVSDTGAAFPQDWRGVSRRTIRDQDSILDHLPCCAGRSPGNIRELRAISHSDRKSDKVDAEKIARYARFDPEILRPIEHRTEQM